MEEKKYVDVFPNKIVLSRNLQQSFYDARITITNLLDKYVVFKVYINKSTQYSANPSTSFIKPNETAIVNIKRIEKDISQADTSKDKFLILTFPVNMVINDNNEAREIIKSHDLKSSSNQEIYLEAEFENAADLGRKTMQNKEDGQLLQSMVSGNSSENTNANYSTVQPMPKLLSPTQELEETKRQIEELKKSIQNYESENNKLNTLLMNYANNSKLYMTKNKVLSKGDSDKQVQNNKFPLSFVVLLITLALTLGAYINRLFSHSQ